MSKAKVDVKLDSLKIARTRAAEDRPYLASALWNLVPVERKGLGTMATDQHWRLYYDPELKWGPKEMSAVLQHEVWHLLRSHHVRAEARGVHPNNAKAWNIAVDLEINDDLMAEGASLPQGCVYPALLGYPNGKLAEEYYDMFPKIGVGQGQGDEPQKGKNKGQAQKLQDAADKNPLKGGSSSDGIKRDFEEPDEADGGAPEVKPLEQELIKRDVAQKVAEAAKARGNVPGGMARWAQELLRPKIDWRKELKATVRHAIEDRAGDQDYSYARPSRRQIPDVVLPSMRDPQVTPAVVVDTSGSISDDYLRQFLGEVQGCIKSCGLDQIPVIFCDAATYGVQKVNKATKLRAQGGGGTDMGVGMAEAEKLRPRPNIIIVLTDGYTPWPQEAPKGVKVIIGVLHTEGSDYPKDQPKWARTIPIEIKG